MTNEKKLERLTKLADYYERQSNNFMPGDIRGPMMAQAAKDMREILDDNSHDANEQRLQDGVRGRETWG